MNYIEEFQNLMNSDIKKEIIDTGEEVFASAENISKAISIYKNIKDIPSKLFLRKLQSYLKGLSEYPYEKRKNYIERVGKLQYNNDCIRILHIINQIDSEEKAIIISRLLINLMDEKIDRSTFFRLCKAVDKTLYEDLIYLKENICNKKIKFNLSIEALEEANLAIHTGITYDFMQGNRECKDFEEYEISEFGKYLYKYGLIK